VVSDAVIVALIITVPAQILQYVVFRRNAKTLDDANQLKAEELKIAAVKAANEAKSAAEEARLAVERTAKELKVSADKQFATTKRIEHLVNGTKTEMLRTIAMMAGVIAQQNPENAALRAAAETAQKNLDENIKALEEELIGDPRVFRARPLPPGAPTAGIPLNDD
jgi:hypothetical protein